MSRTSFCAGLLLALVLTGGAARADVAQDRAGKAFAEGERAFAAGQYRRAAVSFEEAYAASPHSSTLFNAAKAREKGSDFSRAATLFAKIEAEPSSSPRDREDARTAREALLPKVGRIQVTGEFEQASVDGAPVSPSGPSYVEAGEHVVTALVHGRTLRKVVRVGAGEAQLVALSASDAAPAPIAAPAPAPASPSPPLANPAHDSPAEAPRTNVPRVVAYALGGAAILTGGIATWSGVDTLSQKSRFERTGADADLDDGLAKQTRTNVLIAIAVGLVVLTGVVVYLSRR